MSGDDRTQSSDDMLREVQDWLTDQDAGGPSETVVEESPAGDQGPDSAGAVGPDLDALVTGELHIGDRVIEGPTVAQIMDELADLANAEFAVLLRTDSTYMQAAINRFGRPSRRKGKRRSEDETYQLEYQDGSLEEHYEVADGPVPFDRVAEAFRSYAAEDGAWQTEFSWSRLHL